MLKATNRTAYTPKDFAVQIGFHPESVRRAIRDGRIHSILFGNRHLIPAEEAQRVLANGVARPPKRSSTPTAEAA